MQSKPLQQGRSACAHLHVGLDAAKLLVGPFSSRTFLFLHGEN
jgi:hypothetical protein